jgi:hypothetical protein
MFKLTLGTSSLGCGLLILMGLTCSQHSSSGAPQVTPSTTTKEAGKDKKLGYYGTGACVRCHTDPGKIEGLPPVVCRCNEYVTWSTKDKHKIAYTNLNNKQGKQMIDLLHYSEKAVYERCVVCHGVYIPEDKQGGTAKGAIKLDPKEGVSCVACHGPDFGRGQSWVDEHGSDVPGRREEWRKLTREAKENQYGMIDLWDPAKRAKKCASCHIGNAEEGKVITHEMYAAGHPPLPGFEASTFSDAMPKHWQYLSEKNQDALDLLKMKMKKPPDWLERTQLLVIGGIVSLDATMELLARQAENCGQAGNPDERTLDLASFDCYACHHDLKTPSWRQARGYFGKPGRPQFRPWPTALIQLGIFHSGQKEELGKYRQRVADLRAAFDAQPFGEPAKIAAAARALQTWCKGFEDKLKQSPETFTPSAAQALLQELCRIAGAETVDYDTARQMAWAFRIIHEELNPKPSKDADIVKKLADLNQELKLDLPAGQEHQIVLDLPSALSRIADYNPQTFKKIFGELCALLSEK